MFKNLARAIATAGVAASAIVAFALPAHAEVDAVVNTYTGVSQYDLAPQVLASLGKNDSWQVCRQRNLTPSVGYLQTVTNNYSSSLLFTSYLPYGSGSTTQPQQANLMVKLCQEVKFKTKITRWKSVAVVLTDPLDPIFETYLDKGGICHFALTGVDPVLTTAVDFYNKGEYHSYTSADPGQTRDYVFDAWAPRTMGLSVSFYRYSRPFTYVNSDLYAEVNLDDCTVTEYSTTSPIYPPAVG